MKDAIWVLTLLVVGFLAVRGCASGEKLRKEAEGLRKEIFARDSLVRHSDSLVSILVRDNRTSHQLADSLSVVLQAYAKSRGLEPHVVTEITFVPVYKTDTFLLADTGRVVTYYPNEDWFIRHEFRHIEGYGVADWQFRPVSVDLLISETKRGLFEAAVAGPGFIQVRNVTVNSLPFERTEKKTDGWLLGVGALYDWKDKAIIPNLQLGYRLGSHHLLATGWYRGVGLSYLKRL